VSCHDTYLQQLVDLKRYILACISGWIKTPSV